jgi:hypothetical protein
MASDAKHYARYHNHKDAGGMAKFAKTVAGEINDLRGQVKALQGQLHKLDNQRQQQPTQQEQAPPTSGPIDWDDLANLAKGTGEVPTPPVSDMPAVMQPATPAAVMQPATPAATSSEPQARASSQRVPEPKLDLNGDVHDFFRKLDIYFSLAGTPPHEKINRALLNIASPTVGEQWLAYASTLPVSDITFDLFKKQIIIYTGGYGAQQ